MKSSTRCAISILLLSLLPSAAPAQDARLTKAREEKKVVVYNTTTVPDMQKIIEGFNKKYPYLEVESFRSTGERLIQTSSRGCARHSDCPTRSTGCSPTRRRSRR